MSLVRLPNAKEPARVVCGDALEVLRSLPDGVVDAVVSDPPWGIDHNTDYTRFSGGQRTGRRQTHKPIYGDDEPFDPTPLIAFPKVVLWGYHCFAQRLPMGSVFVWQKKPDVKLGKMMSDCELAWCKGGHGVYLFKHQWDGFCRESERGEFYHPSQKPVALMRWCIDRLRLKPGSLILDPYGGAGATAVAAVEAGMRCLLVEQDSDYCDVVRRRLKTCLARGA